MTQADEAHRGQYGLKEKVDAETGKIKIGTARVIRNSLPNATYIGFTGTPISMKDRSTREVFGDYIDVYDISILNLANRSHISDTTIKHYRSGKRTPSLEKLMALFIGINLDEQYCDAMMDQAGCHLNDSDLHKLYRKLIRYHMDGDIDQWNMVLKAGGYEEIPGN